MRRRGLVGLAFLERGIVASGVDLRWELRGFTFIGHPARGECRRQRRRQPRRP
jgi:hypothetical protein